MLALLASLAANLFLVGLIGGQVFAVSEEESAVTRTQTAAGSLGYSLHPRVMRAVLPDARQEAIRAFTREVRPLMRDRWRELRVTWDEIDAALRARPFDADALRAAKRREIEVRLSMRQLYNDTSAAFLATLTDEEREQIADLARANLDEKIEYWRERRRRRDAERQAAAE